MKFEYLVYRWVGDDNSLEGFLDDKGVTGWELVTVHHHNNLYLAVTDVTCYMKRLMSVTKTTEY